MHLIPVRLQRSAVRPAPTANASVARFGMYTAGFLAVVNISIMYLALPQIEAKLGAGIADQQWILSVYPLMEGGFTLAFGVLGDLYGRKRVLAASTWLFILGTFGCAFAPNAGALVVARGIQGMASAALLSLPLAILIELLPDPADNLGAIQLFATVAGLAAGLAPLIGGALVTYLHWPSVFYFSALLGLIVLAGLSQCGDCRGEDRARLDLGGQITSILTCLGISYALIEHKVAALIAAAAFGALFVAIERRTAQPMVNLAYLRIRRFDASVLIVAIVNFGWYGLMLLCTLYLQQILHLREIAVGLYLMPCNAAYFFANLYSGRIARALGMPLTVIVSFIVSLSGMAWLALVHSLSGPWEAALALGLAGVGWGIISTPATAMGMAAVRNRDEGFASGTLALSRSLFGVFGIAVLGSLLTGGMAARLPQNLRAAVHHGSIFEIPAVRMLVEHAYVQALHVSVAVCFVLTLAFGLWTLAMLRNEQSESSSSAAAYS